MTSKLLHAWSKMQYNHVTESAMSAMHIATMTLTAHYHSNTSIVQCTWTDDVLSK